MRLLALLVLPALATAFSVPTFLCKINAFRADNKKAPWGLDDNLSAATQEHSEDMAKTGNVDSTGSDGSDPAARAKKHGFKYDTIYEIVAAAYRSEDDLFDALTGDSQERQQLLSDDYEMFGMGLARNDDDVPYYTVDYARDWHPKRNVPDCSKVVTPPTAIKSSKATTGRRRR